MGVITTTINDFIVLCYWQYVMLNIALFWTTQANSAVTMTEVLANSGIVELAEENMLNVRSSFCLQIMCILHFIVGGEIFSMKI